MDPSDVLQVANAVKLATGALDYLKSRVKGTEDLAKLLELQQAFDAVNDENRRLREELRRHDDKAAARANYERREMGSAVVRVRVEPDGTEGPPCCPKCNDADGEPLPLQGIRRTSRLGTHVCLACNGTFSIPVTPHSP